MREGRSRAGLSLDFVAAATVAPIGVDPGAGVDQSVSPRCDMRLL